MYKRILLKLSGEALKDNAENQIVSADAIKTFASIIKKLHEEGFEVGVVIGAGNIWRGKFAKTVNIEPIPADYMGMLGTVINAVMMSSNLKNSGVPTIVYSAVPAIEGVTETYDIESARQSLSEGKVCFFAGGTGKPFYTTDTAASLRASELDFDAILIGKNGVDGVYDKDPRENSNAVFLKKVTYQYMLENKLQIIDLSAVKLIKDRNIDVRIFSMQDPDNFIKVAHGEDIGTTLIKGE